MLLEGKVALIVGTKDDIGSATAEIMAQEGAKIVVAERNANSGRALVEKILAVGGEAIYQEIDITLDCCHRNLIDRIVAEYGKLDIAFNNVSVDGDLAERMQHLKKILVGRVLDPGTECSRRPLASPAITRTAW